jgi:hypothetical protein
VLGIIQRCFYSRHHMQDLSAQPAHCLQHGAPKLAYGIAQGILVFRSDQQADRFGLGELLIRRSGVLAVRRDLLDCDYYRMLDGDPAAVNSFDGQYMQQYPWSELTSGRLYFRYIDSK